MNGDDPLRHAHRKPAPDRGVLAALRRVAGWPILARSLRAARPTAMAAPMLRARRQLPRPQPRRHVHLGGRGQLGDQLRRPSRPRPRAGRDRARRHPAVPGRAAAVGRGLGALGCAGMPKPAKGDKLGDGHGDGHATDPGDRHHRRSRHAVRGRGHMVARIAGSGLLTFESTEHTVFGTARSTCIDDAVTAYLVDGAMPAPAPAAQPGTRPPSSQPAQSATGDVVGDVFEGAGAVDGMRRARAGSRPRTGRASSHSRSKPTGTRSPTSAVRASPRSSKRSPNASSPNAPVLARHLAHQLGPEAVGAHLEQRDRAGRDLVVVRRRPRPRRAARASCANDARVVVEARAADRAADAVGRREPSDQTAVTSSSRSGRASAPRRARRRAPAW